MATLSVDSGKELKNPSPEVLAEAIKKMSSEAILRRDEVTYLKTEEGAEEGWTLEYQEDSTEFHFKAIGCFARQKVTEAFLAYARQEDTWKNPFTWERVSKDEEEEDETSDHLSTGLMLVLIGLVFVAIELDWIKSYIWIAPAVLLSWGIEHLYRFYRKNRSIPPRTLPADRLKM